MILESLGGIKMIDYTKCAYEVELVLNQDAIVKYVDENFKNQSQFAHELGMCDAHFNKFYRTNIGGGALLWGKLFYYCKANELNFEMFLKQKK